jgi:hypothetical protein
MRVNFKPKYWIKVSQVALSGQAIALGRSVPVGDDLRQGRPGTPLARSAPAE